LHYCLALQKAIAPFSTNSYSVYYKTAKFKNHCFSIAKSLHPALLKAINYAISRYKR
jgi:hypothetical protein